MDLQPVGEGVGAPVRLAAGQSMTLGRNRETRVTDERVSRRHAEVACSAGPDGRPRLCVRPLKRAYALRRGAGGGQQQQQQQQQAPVKLEPGSVHEVRCAKRHRRLRSPTPALVRMLPPPLGPAAPAGRAVKPPAC
jgi:hypothetical protein